MVKRPWRDELSIRCRTSFANVCVSLAISENQGVDVPVQLEKVDGVIVRCIGGHLISKIDQPLGLAFIGRIVGPNGDDFDESRQRHIGRR